MVDNEHKKSRPLYIANFIRAKSDADHWVTQKQIMDYLYEEFGIMPDRKTIKRDIAMLRDEMGMDIEEQPYYGYRLLSREFELDDLKILIECVYAAKFISEDRTNDLIDVLCDFCSENQAKKLKREIYMCDRVKTTQKKTLHIINVIREAMERQRWPSPYHQGRKISFHYTTHAISDVHKVLDKHDGKLYKASPYHLLINDGNYYMLAVDDETKEMRAYRIDRMRDVTVLNEDRESHGQRISNIKTFIRRTFAMFRGEQTKVKMRFENSLLDTVIDKFGVGFGAEYQPDGEDHFIVTMEVEVSDQFFAWLCGFGVQAKIIAPENLVSKYRDYLTTIVGQY